MLFDTAFVYLTIKLSHQTLLLMKTRFLLLIMIIAGFYANAQVVINEEFNGSFPPAGWTIDAHAANWSASNTANAGGTAPEAYFFYDPDFVGTSRLISPTIDLTGHSTVLLQFNHFIDHYDLTYNIGVATRTDGGAWTTALEIPITESVPATTVMVPITGGGTGTSTFQFCIYFSGDSYNINSWSIDNIILTIPVTLDGSVTRITTPTYGTGADAVNAVMTNIGLTDITGFQMNWKVDNGEVFSDVISGQSLSLGDAFEYTSSDPLVLEAGVHDLKMWISNVNGNSTPDDNPANDTLIKVLRVPTQTVERLPFFEEFTSSTCSPCASFNNSVFNPFLNQNGENLVFVKYQMNWPGAGDPYYTEEGGVRRDYYGVGFVPLLMVDGKNAATTNAGVNNAFNQSSNKPAFVTFDSYFAVDGSNLFLRGQFISYADLVDATLQIVVFENITTQNIATNGETEFHHVMMKMLPDAGGTLINSIATGEPFIFEYNIDMSTTNVEEMGDLSVALFLQDNTNKEIFQAGYADLSGVGVRKIPFEKVNIYPNPVSEKLNIIIPASLGDKVTIEFFNPQGNLVKSCQTSGNSTFTMLNEFSKGIYNVRIAGDGQLFTGKFISVK